MGNYFKIQDMAVSTSSSFGRDHNRLLRTSASQSKDLDEWYV